MTTTETTPTTELDPAAENTLLATQAEADPPAEDKPEVTPEDKPDEPAPFDIEKVELPEGLEVSDDQKAKLAEVAGKHNLTSEAVADLMPLVRDALKEASESSTRLWADVNQKWQDEIKADPEFGGPKLKTNLTVLAKAVDQYSPDPAGFRAALDLTGAGNNPAVFRTFVKMAQALAEGGPVAAGGTGGKPKTGAQAMYPNLPSGAS